METTPLFEELLNTDKKIIILQGGGDAGKTVTSLQFLAHVSKYEPGAVTTVTAIDLPNLKRGAIRTFSKYIAPDPYFAPYLANYNISESVQHFKNKSLIEYKSFKNELDARGSERDYLFMNEANSQSYELFWQLYRKTRKKVILDYNPTNAFWVHEIIMKDPMFRGKWLYIQVDHRHNPFLSDEEHERYESISDPDLFAVYARGETGKIQELILGHFKKVDSMPVDCDRYIWGIDYGYTNDPTALVKVGLKGRQRYFQEIAYEPGISAAHIKALLDKHGRKPEQPLYSEHDKEMILQLRKMGVDVRQARKGPGSKIAGISKTKEYECYYIGDNYEREVNAWKYIKAQDLTTGKTILTNEAQDGHDHLCQAGIYAVYTDSFIHRAGY